MIIIRFLLFMKIQTDTICMFNQVHISFYFFFYIKSNIIQLTKKKQLTGHLEKNRP